MLNTTKETVFTVDYGEVERFIKEETGHEYDIPCCEELSNDTTLKLNIDANAREFDKRYYERHKAGKSQILALRNILVCLCAEGKLEPGKYVISISW